MKPLDRSLIRVGFALGLFALSALPAASRDESYGYFRVIEGSATLMQNDGDRQPADVNQPVLAGDRIQVPERSRAEVVLADRNILRIDGGSEILLEQLAASPDRDDPASVLRLQDGNVLLTVTTDSLGDQLPRIETPNATIYTQDFGTYRITTTQGRFTELVVRRGKAEVVTDRGSEIVRAGELAFIEGDQYADIEIESATSYDALERWADRLEGEARYADNDYAGNDYIEDDLRYQAAPLARYGSWIHYSGRPYWRPRVAVDWRPYWHGRWAYTPAGLNWVSYEPWGWVPYHYGSWDYLPGYGWAWAPGHRWAPAWVYWYWGPSYVGWCPTGYYTSFYHHRYPYFRHGVYGWAGGHWDHWNHWSFVRHDYFSGYRHGYRNGHHDARRDHWDVRRYAVPRDVVRRAGPLEPGVITTDTRPVTPDNWNEPRQAIRVLTDHPVVRGQERGQRPNGELPDVTPFIRRMPDLPDNVVRTVVPRDGDTGQGGGTRPTVAERPRGGTPWEGGVIYTDPSDRGRSGGSTPRVRVPNEGNLAGGGNTPSAENPRVARPQPGERGGAPRPDGADTGRNDRNERGSTPRVRVPEMPPQGGEAPRLQRPEPGSPGGAPRPQAGDRSNPRQPEQRQELERRQELEQQARERAREREQQENQENEMRERARERQQELEQQMRERTREREQQQESETRERAVREREQQELEQQMRERAREREQQQEYEMRERAAREREQQREMEEQMREQARERAREQQQESERAREREQQEQQQREQEQRDNEVRERARERETRPPSSYQRPDSSRSYSAPRSVERQREAPPSSSSRPERRQEARPAERERGGSREGESRGSESRGSESRGGGDRSGGSRGSRSRPPGEGGR